MDSPNPYQSPSLDYSPVGVESPGDSAELESLKRLRPAVRCVAVVTALIAVGYAISFGMGVWIDYRLGNVIEKNNPDQVRYARIAAIGTLKQFLMTAAFTYATTLVLRYGAALRRAIEQANPQSPEVLATQRPCWYAAAALAVLYVTLTIGHSIMAYW